VSLSGGTWRLSVVGRLVGLWGAEAPRARLRLGDVAWRRRGARRRRSVVRARFSVVSVPPVARLLRTRRGSRSLWRRGSRSLWRRGSRSLWRRGSRSLWRRGKATGSQMPNTGSPSPLVRAGRVDCGRWTSALLYDLRSHLATHKRGRVALTRVG